MSLLLDAHDAVLAGKVLTEFGSLTGLSRANVANLRRSLPETKAAQLAAALRLAALLLTTFTFAGTLDTPEAVYALYGAECAVVIEKCLQFFSSIPALVSSNVNVFLKGPSMKR